MKQWERENLPLDICCGTKAQWTWSYHVASQAFNDLTLYCYDKLLALPSREVQTNILSKDE